ncbi:AMP-binding protein [Pantoea stewartii]|uniref:AMP-dependent synthetase n=1 Tax=Pantoea stewartii TaxID=66269 RepID=A0AB34VK50_9GAMM|nr:AMP-binding protein [Pantoea stewartii]KTS74618.1 AMP-dependent synthetase [Pantoea stewartii]KTT00905.1 AMP-dependent synthetase [Pantoea stewartii]KTT08423.1 AMP-dependent synthetase [Pantoea stewartii]
MFQRTEQQNPSQIAVIDDSGNTLTYYELTQLADELARHLTSGTIIFIFCENSIGTLIGYLACLRKGAVPLMLDSQLDLQRISTLTECYYPAFFWQPIEITEKKIQHQTYGYQLILSTSKPAMVHPDLALLMTTSGSTGSAKMVRLSRQNLQSNAESIRQYLGITVNERPLIHLPMHYVFGLSVVNSHLLAGATLVMTRFRMMQREFWQHIQETEVTSLSGVPYTFEMLHRLRFSNMYLPALRTLTQAGGKLSTKLHHFFADYARQHNKQFIVMYGAAEATSRMAWLPPEMACEKCGSIGKSIPGGELILMDDQGQEVTDVGIQGELVYKGSNVMMGYAMSAADLLRGDDLGGVLHTGDIATRDSQGYFTVVGRKKRFLKIFGNRIGLDEMELLLKNQFSDQDIACTGRDDHLTIFLTTLALKDEIKRYAAKITQLHPSAFSVIILDSIPLTASGKINYERLDY